MCRLQPAAHFVRGSPADPWTTAGDCPNANQQREPIQRRTIRSDICILSICTPWKSANTYPPPRSPSPICSPPPHDVGSTPWPRGQPLSLQPTHLPLLPLVYTSDPVRPGDNTWPRPWDGLIGVQGKCPFASVCMLPCPAPGPYPYASFWALSHKHLKNNNNNNNDTARKTAILFWKTFILVFFFSPLDRHDFPSQCGPASSALQRRKHAHQELQ